MLLLYFKISLRLCVQLECKKLDLGSGAARNAVLLWHSLKGAGTGSLFSRLVNLESANKNDSHFPADSKMRKKAQLHYRYIRNLYFLPKSSSEKLLERDGHLFDYQD